jgi:hypothetical protein
MKIAIGGTPFQQPMKGIAIIVFYLKLSMEWGAPRRFLKVQWKESARTSLEYTSRRIFFTISFALALPAVGLSLYTLAFYPTAAFLTLISSYFTVQVLYRLPFSYITVGKPRKRDPVKRHGT